MSDAEILAREFFSAMPGPRRWPEDEAPGPYYLSAARAMLEEGSDGDTFRELTRSTPWKRAELARIVRRARREGPSPSERVADLQRESDTAPDLGGYVNKARLLVAVLERALESARDLERLATAAFTSEAEGGIPPEPWTDPEAVDAAYQGPIRRGRPWPHVRGCATAFDESCGGGTRRAGLVREAILQRIGGLQPPMVQRRAAAGSFPQAPERLNTPPAGPVCDRKASGVVSATPQSPLVTRSGDAAHPTKPADIGAGHGFPIHKVKSSTPEYQTGDSVGWARSRRLSAGTGCISEVLPPGPDGTIVYRVAKLLRGKATGVTLEIPQDQLYRTRSLHDDDPIPEALA